MNKLAKTLVVANVIFALSGISAFAQGTQPTPSLDNDYIRKEKPVRDLACMQVANEKRDNAVIAAAKIYSADLIKALEVRRDSLKAAWGMTDPAARQKAIKAAWDTFRSSKKKAVSAWKEARKNAWRQYYVDRKACGARGASEDKANESADTDL